MGYFSNGTEVIIYEEKYCERCVHLHPEHGCPALDAHYEWNYEECNNPNSILHKIIPRRGTENRKCYFFKEKKQRTPRKKKTEPPDCNQCLFNQKEVSKC